MTAPVLHPCDFIRPRLRAGRQERVVLYAAMRLRTAPPHLGVHVLQTCTFLLAKAVRERFGVEVLVRFTALDDLACETRECPATGTLYERTVRDVLGTERAAERAAELLRTHYDALFTALSAATGVAYETGTYTEQQARPAFREELLASLGLMDTLRWVLAPSTGSVPVRLPCPHCGWAQRHGEHTELLSADARGARFAAVCLDHGTYMVDVTRGNDTFVGLTALHRSHVAERVAVRDSALPVIVEGADRAMAGRLLDEAFRFRPGAVPPPRLLTPLVLTESGAKLSGTSAGEKEEAEETEETEEKGEKYPGMLINLVSRMLSSPQYFERGYTMGEVTRLAGVTVT
ncbi:hypothetical protein [Streptomyces sp. NPDC001404]|uniref:hypothetical protein n=1 Tax=Streptomyces sp. NPDC001404 TaxID=3364571 RepID=UPI0036B90829